MKMEQLRQPSTIRLKPEVKQWLLQIAFVEKRTLSNLVNKILIEHKEEKEKATA